jgi:acyl-CoA dehydrogenase
MQAARQDDKQQALSEFDQALFGHIGFILSNLGRTFWQGLSGGRLSRAPAGVGTGLQRYYRRLNYVSASFALVADSALLILGGELKRREKLSARFGDVLSSLYLLSCTLKRFEDDQRPEADLPLVHWNAQRELYTIQQTLDDILANFPSPLAGWLLRRLVFPWGRRWSKPSDHLGHACARLLLEPSEARDRLTRNMFISRDPKDITGILEYALEQVLAAEAIEVKLTRAGFTGTHDEAAGAGLISADEAHQLAEAAYAVDEVIRVDDFAPQEMSGQRQDSEAVAGAEKLALAS